MNKWLRFLLGCMLIFSFYTHTIDLDSGNLIISRMTFSDIFGVLAIILFFMNIIINKKYPNNFPKLFILAYGVAICFFITVITSLSPKSTIYETLILFYLITLSFVVYEVFKNQIKPFFVLLVITSFLMSFIGLYDLFATNNELFTFFKNIPKKHAVSGFRYFAQAGNYSFTMLSILIPFRYYYNSNLKLNSRERKFFNITILLTVLFMIASGAVSIMISFFIGVVLLVIMNLSNKKILVDVSMLVGVVLSFFISIYFYAKDLFQNIIYRIESRVTERQVGTPEASFIIENFKGSIQAFKDHCFFGTGLGGFVNNYSEFEIHGTYLKVLGETGLIGVLGYSLFLICLIKFIYQLDKQYLKYFIPFFIASLLSWSYNYHFRKKEFWLLFSFLMMFKYVFDKKKSNAKA